MPAKESEDEMWEKRREEKRLSIRKYREKLRQKCIGSKGTKGIVNTELFKEESVPKHSVGKMDNICCKCAALMFNGECNKQTSGGTAFSLCCSKGKVSVPPISKPPLLLQEFLQGSSARLQHFLQHIRSHNLSFAFASMSLTGDEYRFSTLGPYCFRISGQVYYLISQLLPASGDALKFSQIYLYDASDEIDAWVQIFSNLQKDIFTSLQKMLDDVNPYAKLYHGA